MLRITSSQSLGLYFLAAAEARGSNCGVAAQADAIGEQQLKWMQSGSIWVWPCDSVGLARSDQRCYCIRLLARESRGLHWTHTDVVKETRPLKHTYVCMLR